MISDSALRERAHLEEIRRLQDELRDAYRLRRPISVWETAAPSEASRPQEILLTASLLVPGWPKLGLRAGLALEMWHDAPQSLPFLVGDWGRALIRQVDERRAVDEGSGTA